MLWPRSFAEKHGSESGLRNGHKLDLKEARGASWNQRLSQYATSKHCLERKRGCALAGNQPAKQHVGTLIAARSALSAAEFTSTEIFLNVRTATVTRCNITQPAI